MLLRFGIVGGTGPAGSALAARLAAAGHEVVLGSRVKERALEARDRLVGRWPERGLAIEPGDNAMAAGADVVVVASSWDGVLDTVGELDRLLHGKVVVSMVNALVRSGGEFLPLLAPRGSIAMSIQAAVPQALVVAALHHVPARELAAIDTALEADVLVCSDHSAATASAFSMLGRIPGVRALDAGGLSNAMAIEAFTAVLLQLNARYKTRAGIHFTGIDDADPTPPCRAPRAAAVEIAEAEGSSSR